MHFQTIINKINLNEKFSILDYSMDYADPDEYSLNAVDVEQCYKLAIENYNFTAFSYQRINSACILKRTKTNPFRCSEYSICMNLPGELKSIKK